VGKSAFAHKGGAHGSAVRRDASTYEHVDPHLVGNTNKLVVSEIAGRSMVLQKADDLAVRLTKAQLDNLLGTIKTQEYQGYTYEAADASLSLLLLREAGALEPFFKLEGYDIHLHRGSEKRARVDAVVKIKVEGKRYITAAEGNGPVNALDNALRKSLEPLFPELRRITLLDYKVRVLEGADGTRAVTRVLIETGDGHETWGTVGVNENVIKASWDALYDSIVWGLFRLRREESES
jgi:2-isopropylmalate synthase